MSYRARLKTGINISGSHKRPKKGPSLRLTHRPENYTAGFLKPCEHHRVYFHTRTVTVSLSIESVRPPSCVLSAASWNAIQHVTVIFCCPLLRSQEKKELSLNLLPQPLDRDPSLSGLSSPVSQSRCSWCYQTVSTWVSAWAAHPQEQAACLWGRFPGKMQLFTQLVRNEYYLCPLQLTASSSALRFGDNWLCWVTWLLDSGCLAAWVSDPTPALVLEFKWSRSACRQESKSQLVWEVPLKGPPPHPPPPAQDGLTGFHGPVFPHGW